MTPRLVFLEHFVPEGGGVNVKGENYGVGLYLRLGGEKNIEKAEDGVCKKAVLGGEYLYSVIRTVHNAV